MPVEKESVSPHVSQLLTVMVRLVVRHGAQQFQQVRVIQHLPVQQSLCQLLKERRWEESSWKWEKRSWRGKEMGRGELERKGDGKRGVAIERKGDGKRGVGEEKRWEEGSCNREERRWEERSCNGGERR